jgi:hypothetical protein
MCSLRQSLRHLILPLVVVSVALLSVERAAAGFVLVTDRATLSGSDTVDWGQVGSELTAATNPFSISSSGGVMVDVSRTGRSVPFQRRDQGSSWQGNFADGAHLLWTTVARGSMTIDFSNSVAVTGAGAQIQPIFTGSFVARVEVLSSDGTVLAFFDVPGYSSNHADNSAVFIGVSATDGDSFDKIRYEIVSGDPNRRNLFKSKSFALNELSFTLQSNILHAPVPPTAVLFGLGLVGLTGLRLVRRRPPASAG